MRGESRAVKEASESWRCEGTSLVAAVTSDPCRNCGSEAGRGEGDIPDPPSLTLRFPLTEPNRKPENRRAQRIACVGQWLRAQN